jgi:hypothetical protein
MRKEKGLMTGKKEPAAKIGGNGYQEVNAKSGDEKHLKITFAVIEKMHYSDFNSGNEAEDFKPSDIIDEEDASLSDDEVLKKFKNDINIRMINKLPMSEFDTKQLGRGRSKENLNTVDQANPSLGLGLKQQGITTNQSPSKKFYL